MLLTGANRQIER